MIRLYPEQLRAQLNEGLRAAYLLLGNDPLLLQESQDAVRQVAAAQGFEEHHTFSIDPNTDWNAIFSLWTEKIWTGFCCAATDSVDMWRNRA